MQHNMSPQLLCTPLWKESFQCRLSSILFLCSSALAPLHTCPSPRKKYLFNRFCIALAFPFLADADVLALMEPFILLNGEKDFLHTPTELQLRLLQEMDTRKVLVRLGPRFPGNRHKSKKN